jgi:threonine-phosphate decarboxylase
MSEKLNCPTKNILYPTHGGSRHVYMDGLGVPEDHIIDFSASVIPLGSNPELFSALDDLGRLVCEYPETNSFLFGEKVSTYLKVPSEWILVTNGSTELIHLLPRLLESNKEALILNPCFSEYERALELSGIHVHSLTYDAESLFQMDSERVTQYLHQHPSVKMLVLGHPNNPTGHLWDDDELESLVLHCESQEVVLVVDETFIEFCHEAVSALKWMRNSKYLVVVRSMTKFFGLAGVRLGYGVMHPSLKARLKKFQIPWSVNSIAQKMGINALSDDEYPIQTRIMVCECRTRLVSRLNTIPRLRIFPSQANFILFQLLVDTLEETHRFYVGLFKSGILIRNCGNFRGLDNSYFRVAVRSEKEGQILASGIEDQLNKEW